MMADENMIIAGIILLLFFILVHIYGLWTDSQLVAVYISEMVALSCIVLGILSGEK